MTPEQEKKLEDIFGKREVLDIDESPEIHPKSTEEQINALIEIIRKS